ncbi:membrane protein [Alphaproteobacteria bacterium]|nr:membrane protein [Alphaproteobacteria bacterium]GHS95939.1 membrane protein [Alphaproteobacteria bacterium]
MKLSEICIERPVFAWVMTSIVLLVGLVLGGRLPLQQYPKIERPAVSIETTMQGAAPEIVEAQITKKLEEAFAGIEGIDHIQSNSNTNSSHITIVFRQDRNIDEAVNDIRDRISKERDNLPKDAKEPIVSKYNSDEGAIIGISFWSDKMERNELYDFVSQDLQKDFESVPGVGKVSVFGDGLFVMNLYVDPRKMASYSITVNDVTHAIISQNLELPAGTIVSKNREYLVTTVANLERPEEFENMIILAKNGKLVRLSDIGRAEIQSAKAKTRSYFNGRRGVSLYISKQSNVNPISVARGVKKELENIKKTRLPDDVKVLISYDDTLFVERSLTEVYHTIFEAVVMVTLVVLLFLKSFRAALIPLVTIPVSLIGTMTFMSLFKFSLNTFTLLAFVLAVGLVVDDAIVVLENVHRYMEKGYSRLKASLLGIREVSFAVIAMTLTLAAVYAPIALATGITGKLLSEFSVTLACAVILSGFVALTLSPMMCSRVLELPEEQAFGSSLLSKLRNFSFVDTFMSSLAVSYERFLRKVLAHKGFVLLCALAFAGLGFAVYLTLPPQLFPKQDTGEIRIEGHSPQSATIDYTERYIQELDALLAAIPEVESRDISITNPTFKSVITLKSNRKRSSDAVVEEIRDKIRDITGIEFQGISTGSGGTSGADAEVDFVVRGNKSHKELRDLARAVGLEFRSSGMTKQILSAIQNDTEDYTVTILRDKALSLFIDPRTIADSIDALIRGRKVNTFKKDNKLYDVKIEVENESRSAPEDILNIHVRSEDREGKHKLIPLSELILLTPRSGPVEIFHYNRTRAVSVRGTLEAGYGVTDGIKYVDNVKKGILPQDVTLEYVGSTHEFLQESRVMATIFALALIFIYLVMAAQFESWRDPLIILLSVPLAIISAVLTLALIKNGSLNMYSNIGLITLIGLITKHGILMVDFANKMQMSDNLPAREAIIQAGRVRLRPIIMTTLAMVLGNLPLAFASGAGAETRWQLGWTIVGGMTLGTLFTMFVVPVFYLLLSKVKTPLVLENV